MRGDEFFTQVLSRPPFSKMHPRVAALLRVSIGEVWMSVQQQEATD
jgi:hypothetical protein